MSVALPERARPERRSLSKHRLRLWLRLLRSSRAIEGEISRRMRASFDVTLPQFDVMAALARSGDGMTMTELSRRLMVSNGNVTGIIDRLAGDGLVERKGDAGDRRAVLVRLTAKGASRFDDMALVHEGWVDELLSTFAKPELELLIAQLDGLPARVREGGRRP